MTLAASDHEAHYLFNDNAASTVLLDNRSAHNGVLNTNSSNLYSASGKINGTLINPATNYANCGTGWTHLTSGAISFWAKPTGGYNIGDGYEGIFTFYTSNGLRAYGAFLTTNGTFVFSINTATNLVASTLTSWNDQWYWFYIEFGAGGMNMYVDNIFNSFDSYFSGLNVIGNATLYFYTDYYNSTVIDNYKGAIDDFRVFNRILTSDERDFVYNSGNGTELEAPVSGGNISVIDFGRRLKLFNN